jgi:hypothetical protein
VDVRLGGYVFDINVSFRHFTPDLVNWPAQKMPGSTRIYSAVVATSIAPADLGFSLQK